MNRFANIAALGYGAFALTLWLASMQAAGWFDQHADNSVLPLVMVALGTGVLAVAGILQWWRGHNLDATLFIGFAAYWWVASQSSEVAAAQADGGTPAGFLGWYFLGWALLAFCIWATALHHDVSRMLFSAGLCLALVADALANWIRLDALSVLGGYLGLVTAIVGLYICAAELLNETRHHTVLPLGESGDGDGAHGP